MTRLEKNISAAFLLLCATAHCVLSIFYTNQSFITLRDYAEGREKLPFQGRMLMSFLLGGTEHNHMLLSVAARFTHHVAMPEPFTVYKLVSLIAALLATAALGVALSAASRRLNIRPWWLPWSLLLLILYVSYAARYEQNLWYPYDLPHMAVFGLAAIFLFIDEPLWFVLAAALDCSIRETALFVIVLAVVMRFRQRSWWLATGAGTLAWIASRIAVHYLYPHNPVILDPRPEQVRYLLPWHWPQLLSIVGFLPIPVLLSRRFLPPMHRRALYAAPALMISTFYFAVWAETRAWLEWSTAFAIWASMILVDRERRIVGHIPGTRSEAVCEENGWRVSAVDRVGENDGVVRSR